MRPASSASSASKLLGEASLMTGTMFRISSAWKVCGARATVGLTVRTGGVDVDLFFFFLLDVEWPFVCGAAGFSAGALASNAALVKAYGLDSS